MSYLDALWTYQQADLQVDQFEAEIRQNPMRKKLIKLRNFFKEQQNAMKSAEEGADRLAAAFVQARQQYEQLGQLLESQIGEVREDTFETASQIKEERGKVEKTAKQLETLLSQMEEMQKQAVRLGQSLKNARANAAKAKTDYAQLKEQYDQEFAEPQTRQLDTLKAKRDALTDTIAPEVMEKYRAIKKCCAQPMAMLEGDKCGGCKMALPALIISQARKAERMVECETCGRILYIP